MWHYASWRLWGNWQDRLAWQGLATRIPKDEIQQIRIREGRVKGGKTITPAKSEAARLNQKEAAKRMKELKTGVYALTREQSSLACKGKIWITDGQSTRRIYPDQQIPKGWKRGRTLK